jgi:diadenosine tetraphosphate (Ap4A) HIT family hydrolase
VADCKFCDLIAKQGEVRDFGSVVAMLDCYPVTPSHWLVLPRVHRVDFFGMSERERRDAEAALFALREETLRRDPTVSGFNIGWNCGTAAGQTVMHAHGHLIPRRIGDVGDPTGGVGGVIPAKQRYFPRAEPRRG